MRAVNGCEVYSSTMECVVHPVYLFPGGGGGRVGIESGGSGGSGSIGTCADLTIAYLSYSYESSSEKSWSDSVSFSNTRARFTIGFICTSVPPSIAT